MADIFPDTANILQRLDKLLALYTDDGAPDFRMNDPFVQLLQILIDERRGVSRG